MGLIVQFDPDDVDVAAHALPMYINAEYMVESRLQVIECFCYQA